MVYRVDSETFPHRRTPLFRALLLNWFPLGEVAAQMGKGMPTIQTFAVLNSSQNYGHLAIAGSGTKTLAGIESVAGNVTISSYGVQ